MTAIDLTRDQCAALANFLRRTVDRGTDSGYDEIELLVLAQRALRNAAKAVGDGLKELPNVIACDVPKSDTPEEGAVSAAREAARPSGASEAARFKRNTTDRLAAFRSSQGLGCLGRLERLCGIPANTLHGMCERQKFPVEMWRQVAAALDKLEGGSEDGRQSE
nr:MAG TPA: hypothetical protein [Caudoviricetes sp.]